MSAFRSEECPILGIETSCDDTAAAILLGKQIRASVVSSQDEVHGPYGGVVPELASRHHMCNVLPVVNQALTVAGLRLDEIGGIAVTCGPGLVGSLLVGVSVAKALALAQGLPLIGVNHLEGHVLAVLLEQEVEFPFLCLLVSGGHTSLYLVRDWGAYQRLGGTRDDAAGEAFDKGAKMLGLGYPGGRVIDNWARTGNPSALRFPRAHFKPALPVPVPPPTEGGRQAQVSNAQRRGKYEFSFSGLKTALRDWLMTGGEASIVSSASALADVAASYQEAIVDMLIEPTLRAARDLDVGRVVIAGGVSANSRLRHRIQDEGCQHGLQVFLPSFTLCTDNAAMIAFAGAWRLACGQRASLDLNASATLPL